MAGSSATHHTSPRWGGGLLSEARIIGYVACQVLDPFRRLALAFLVGRHGAICLRQFAPGHMRARKVVEEPAYPPPSNDGVEAVIDIVLDREIVSFLVMAVASCYTYSIRIALGRPSFCARTQVPVALPFRAL